MNELENKIKEYLVSVNMTLSWNDKMAHDITEIVEKEWQDRIDCEKCNDLQDDILIFKSQLEKLREANYRLEKENNALKKQLSNQKHLNRNEIWDCFEYELQPITLGTKITLDNINNIITAICKLALPQQKYLDRKEVEKIIKEELSFEYDEILSRYGVCNINEIVTAICKLAVKIDKDKIVEILRDHRFCSQEYGDWQEIATEILQDKIDDKNGENKEDLSFENTHLGKSIDCYDKQGNIINERIEDNDKK